MLTIETNLTALLIIWWRILAHIAVLYRVPLLQHMLSSTSAHVASP